MKILKMSVSLCKTNGFCMGVDPKIDPGSIKSGSGPPRALRASPQGTKRGALSLTNDSFW